MDRSSGAAPFRCCLDDDAYQLPSSHSPALRICRPGECGMSHRQGSAAQHTSSPGITAVAMRQHIPDIAIQRELSSENTQQHVSKTQSSWVIVSCSTPPVGRCAAAQQLWRGSRTRLDLLHPGQPAITIEPSNRPIPTISKRFRTAKNAQKNITYFRSLMNDKQCGC